MKELSPHNGGSETQNQMEMEETEMSGEGSGLQYNLSTDEEGDTSPHLFNYREAMTQINEWEEKLAEQLREMRQRAATELDYLLGIMEQPDYDLDTFVSRTKSFLEEGSRNLHSARETFDALVAAMQLEEQASKQMSRQKP